MALKSLETQHLTAIQYMSLPKSQRPSKEEIAEKCGVSRSTLYAWINDPLFEAALKRQIVRNNLDDLPDLVQSLTAIAIRDGNAAAAKLALQVHGMLADKVEVQSTTTYTETSSTDIEALKARIMAHQRRDHAEEETPVS